MMEQPRSGHQVRDHKCAGARPPAQAHGGVSGIHLVLIPLAFPLKRDSDSHARASLSLHLVSPGDNLCLPSPLHCVAGLCSQVC